MRCSNIKITLEIPVAIDQPDGNGIIYTEEAIINACEAAKNDPLPIIQFVGEEPIILGIGNIIDFKDSSIIVEGMMFNGGTAEEATVISMDKKTILGMIFHGIGFAL